MPPPSAVAAPGASPAPDEEILTTSHSLPGDGDAEPLLRGDEVVVVVVTGVELHPVDLPGEAAAVGVVVRADRRPRLVADVGGLVGGEDHRLGGLHPTGPDLLAVVEE